MTKIKWWLKTPLVHWYLWKEICHPLSGLYVTWIQWNGLASCKVQGQLWWAIDAGITSDTKILNDEYIWKSLQLAGIVIPEFAFK